MRAIMEGRGKDFQAKLRCLSLTAAVYFIWQERNNRVFRREVYNWEIVLQQVENMVRDASRDWKAPHTFRNWILCREWG